MHSQKVSCTNCTSRPSVSVITYQVCRLHHPKHFIDIKWPPCRTTGPIKFEMFFPIWPCRITRLKKDGKGTLQLLLLLLLLLLLRRRPPLLLQRRRPLLLPRLGPQRPRPLSPLPRLPCLVLSYHSLLMRCKAKDISMHSEDEPSICCSRGWKETR